jgi:hypothetical protein
MQVGKGKHEGAGPEDPAQLLAELQKELTKRQADADRAAKDRDSLKTRLDAIRKQSDELKPVISGYTQVYKSLEDSQRSVDDADEAKTRIAECGLGPRKERIDAIVKDYDAATEKQADAVARAKHALDAATADRDEAKTAYDAAQSTIADLKAYQKRLSDDLSSKTKDQLKAVEAAEKAGALASMYIILQQLAALANDTRNRLIRPDEFQTNAYQALDDSDQAWSDLKQKNDALDAAIKAYADENQKYQDLVANRTQHLLDAVKPFDQAPRRDQGAAAQAMSASASSRA